MASPSRLGSVARISSVTVPSARRASSSRIRRSSGPTPSMGLIAPPSTWYLPRNSRVRSMATTSLGSSTTQMTVRSRRASRQMPQRSSCATFPHTAQKRTLSFTSSRECARRRTSVGSAWRMWKAIRCALLGPTPGSLPSSSMRSWTTPSYNGLPFLELGRSYSWCSYGSCCGARLEGETRHSAETLGQRAELLLAGAAARSRSPPGRRRSRDRRASPCRRGRPPWGR